MFDGIFSGNFHSWHIVITIFSKRKFASRGMLGSWKYLSYPGNILFGFKISPGPNFSNFCQLTFFLPKKCFFFKFCLLKDWSFYFGNRLMERLQQGEAQLWEKVPFFLCEKKSKTIRKPKYNLRVIWEVISSSFWEEPKKRFFWNSLCSKKHWQVVGFNKKMDDTI